MNDKTLELINELAQKLGTTAEYLWAVLLKQAHVSAWQNAIGAVGMIIATALVYMFLKKAIKASAKCNCEDEVAYGFFIAILGVFAILFTCISFSVASSAITAFANPEYWALEQILNR